MDKVSMDYASMYLKRHKGGLSVSVILEIAVPTVLKYTSGYRFTKIPGCGRINGKSGKHSRR